MSKKPKTTGEHLIALYGHLTGVKREVSIIKNNHLKHIHQDIDKIDQKIDTITNWIIYGLGALAVALLGQVLYFFSN
tara:strand:+ start:264 stop:494 length:231 start_codon:yes stop_codon:yes gene_type:complete